MMLKAQAYVKTVRESQEKDGVEQNVELQICAMGIEPIDKTKIRLKDCMKHNLNLHLKQHLLLKAQLI